MLSIIRWRTTLTTHSLISFRILHRKDHTYRTLESTFEGIMGVQMFQPTLAHVRTAGWSASRASTTVLVCSCLGSELCSANEHKDSVKHYWLNYVWNAFHRCTNVLEHIVHPEARYMEGFDVFPHRQNSRNPQLDPGFTFEIIGQRLKPLPQKN